MFHYTINRPNSPFFVVVVIFVNFRQLMPRLMPIHTSFTTKFLHKTSKMIECDAVVDHKYNAIFIIDSNLIPVLGNHKNFLCVTFFPPLCVFPSLSLLFSLHVLFSFFFFGSSKRERLNKCYNVTAAPNQAL